MAETVDEMEVYLETQRLAVMAAGELQKAMEQAGLTNSELAERIGVPRSRVTRVLDGEDNFTLKTLALFGLGCGFRWSFSPVGMPMVMAAPTSSRMRPAQPSELSAAAPFEEAGAVAPCLGSIDAPFPFWALN
jgi:transcriptional regulator with XRE-family HTH domain